MPSIQIIRFSYSFILAILTPFPKAEWKNSLSSKKNQALTVGSLKTSTRICITKGAATGRVMTRQWFGSDFWQV